MDSVIEQAVNKISEAAWCTAFTGAGISVESGVPPFRGENGLWNTYDPSILELDYFYKNPEKSWPVIKEIFYRHFTKAQPNEAHLLLAKMEKEGILRTLITQNIDDLHYRAGSRNVVEYHGNSRQLVCTSCGKKSAVSEEIISANPPTCECGGIYKPDFIFFGESIPFEALEESGKVVEKTDCMILIGTTGEVYPAAMIPFEASRRGATIIEINPQPSNYTEDITDIHIPRKAGEAGRILQEALGLKEPH
ncbi:MAG: SIR2 family NAD-dependent protein deacylase [Spirochaetaceae bacterium]